MCAPCKVILDCQGAIQSSAEALISSQKTLVETFNKLHGFGTLAPGDERILLDFSEKVSNWAHQLDDWRWEGLNLYKKIAERTPEPHKR